MSKDVRSWITLVVGLVFMSLVVVSAMSRDDKKAAHPIPHTPEVGWHMMMRDAVSCLRIEDLNRIISLHEENDDTAANTAMASHMMAGDCRIAHQKWSVYVEDNSVYHGTSCVRPTGETRCFWVYSNAVK
jgi:hypothetical protein